VGLAAAAAGVDLDVDRETLLMVGVALGVAVAFAVPIGLGILAYRRIQKVAKLRLSTILENADNGSAPPNTQQVAVLCFAYYGLLATLTTVRIEVKLPPERALELLDRVHRFNMTWGWFAAGGFFVPLASLWRRAQQRRSIKKQLEQK
jgi:hypothetical protein